MISKEDGFCTVLASLSFRKCKTLVLMGHVEVGKTPAAQALALHEYGTLRALHANSGRAMSEYWILVDKHGLGCHACLPPMLVDPSFCAGLSLDLGHLNFLGFFGFLLIVSRKLAFRTPSKRHNVLIAEKSPSYRRLYSRCVALNSGAEAC